MKYLCFASSILAGVIVMGCAKPEPAPVRSNFKVAYSGPSDSGIALNYTNYPKITEDNLPINPYLAMRCLGATEDEIADAEKKYGERATASFVIHMNRMATRSFRSGEAEFPVGAAIVKRETISGGPAKDGAAGETIRNGVAVMVKRASGYDPDHGDWEYLYFDDPAKIESGRIESCVKCHSAAKATDYVFGSWRKEKESAGGQ